MIKKSLIILTFFLIILVPSKVIGAEDESGGSAIVKVVGTYSTDLYSNIWAKVMEGEKSDYVYVNASSSSAAIGPLAEACRAKGGYIKIDTIAAKCVSYKNKFSETSLLGSCSTASTGSAFMSCSYTNDAKSKCIINQTKMHFLDASKYCTVVPSSCNGRFSLNKPGSMTCTSASESILQPLPSSCPATHTAVGFGGKCITTEGTPTDKLVSQEMRGNQYKLVKSGGSQVDAYCIQPGKKYKNGMEYRLDGTFDVTRCSSSSSSMECGLAYILKKADELDYSYGVTLVALRLWAAYKSGDSYDGWWEETTQLTSTEKLFMSTAAAILSSGYTGAKPSDPNSILIYYRNSTSQSAASKAFGLFRETAGGASMSGGLGKVTANKTIVDFSKKKDTIILSTPFTPETELEITATNGVKVENGSSLRADSSGKVQVTVSVSECKIDNFTLNIKAKGPNSSFSSIERYVPASGSEYQIMVGYDKEGSEVALYFETNCSGDDNCCKDMYIVSDIPDDCVEDGTNKGEIKDPKMECILKSCDQAKKDVYDTKTKYINAGANKYCKLYCREEMEITLMPKVKAVAGMKFKYQLSGVAKSGSVLSTVSKNTKECNTEMKKVDWDAWLVAYNNANKAIKDTWNNFKFWETLYNHIGEKFVEVKTETCSCGCPCDWTCTATHPETGSCIAGHCQCGCSGSSNSGPITRWFWGTKGSGPFPYATATDLKGGNKTGNLATHSSGGYACPGYYSSCHSCSPGVVTQSPTPTDSAIRSGYSSSKEAYTAALATREQLVLHVQNCSLNSYEDYKFKTSHDGINILGRLDISSAYDNVNREYINEFNSTDTSIDINYQDPEYGGTPDIEGLAVILENSNPTKWCGLDKECKNASDLVGTSTPFKVDYLSCAGMENSARCTNTPIIVPYNNWANFDTKVEADYWQEEEYYSNVYTEKVLLENQVSYDQINIDRTVIKLEPYIYPVGLYTLNGRYWSDADYSNLYKRFIRALIPIKYAGSKTGNGAYRCYYDVVNVTVYYECKDDDCIDIDDPVPTCTNPPCDKDSSISLGFIFRPVDLSKLFPNDRTPGLNWLNENILGEPIEDIIKRIEEKGDNVWIREDPEYSFTLTPDNIKSLRNYNKTKNAVGGYLDNSIGSCEENYTLCTSAFLKPDNLATYISDFKLLEWRYTRE